MQLLMVGLLLSVHKMPPAHFVEELPLTTQLIMSAESLSLIYIPPPPASAAFPLKMQLPIVGLAALQYIPPPS